MIGRLAGALSVACLGLGLVRWAQDLAPEVPEGWRLGEPPAPVLWAGLLGDGPPDPSALDLDAFAVASPVSPGFTLGSVAVDARVPRDGLFVVRFGEEARGPEPASRDPHFPRPPVVLAPLEEAVAVVVDRGQVASVRAYGLDCPPLPTPGERFHLALRAMPGGLGLSLDGADEIACSGSLPAGTPSLGSGLRRVQIIEASYVSANGAVSSASFGGPWRGPLPRWLAALAAGSAFAWFAPGPSAARGGGSSARLRRPVWAGLVLALLPLLAWPALGRFDPVLVAQSLRLLHLSGPFIAPSLVLFPTACLVSAALAWHGGIRLSLGFLAVLGAALAACLGLAGWTLDAPGLLLLGSAGLPLALLAHVNRRGPRGASLYSLALCVAFALWLEAGLRLTALREDWDDRAGWEQDERTLYALLEERRYRAYPDEGYPVKPPSRTPKTRRILALGGSSTGGAFQMDDLHQFWPTRLGERLAGRGWEVVNQGVGGWNSLHIRLYLEQQIDRLDPDLIVLYAGHNDLGPSSLTMREAFARHQRRGRWVAAVSGLLARSRAVTGLRYALLSGIGRGGTVAVPLPDARENLEAIAQVAGDHAARVLFVTEGLHPDPAPMAEYGEMMRDLARSTGNLWLDGAGVLDASGSPDIFIDDCHLSAQGHRVLAERIEEALDRAGWLAPAGSEP